MSRVTSYNPRVFELAEFFLANEPGQHNTVRNQQELALVIQQAVEDYLEELARR